MPASVPHRRPIGLLILLLLLALAGCSAGPDPTPTQTPAATQSAGQADLQVDAKWAGTGTLALNIQADTRLPGSDSSGAGEPYFVVKAAGETERETEVVDRAADGVYTYQVQVPPDTNDITVILMDEDIALEDEFRQWFGPLPEPGTRPSTTPAPGSPSQTPTDQPTTHEPTSTTRESTPTPATGPAAFSVTVVEVVDGDTVDIRYRNGTQDTIRLLGVDTPEVHVETAPDEWEGVPNTKEGAACLSAEGTDASNYATQQLSGERVRITLDAEADTGGSFGRLRVYILHDGANFNYRLVTEGYARIYDSTFSKRDRFYAAEESALSAQRGAWRCQDVRSSTTTTQPPTGGPPATP